MSINLLNRNLNDSKTLFAANDLIVDLELKRVFDVMAGSDDFMFETVKEVMLAPLTDKEDILFRQDVLKDVINNENIFKNIYEVAQKAVLKKRHYYWAFDPAKPSIMLVNLATFIGELFDYIIEIRDMYSKGTFASEGMKEFFKVIAEEFNDEFIKEARVHLNELKFSKGVIINAELGKTLEGVNYELMRPGKERGYFLKWKFTPKIILSDTADREVRDINYRLDKAQMKSADVIAKAALYIVNFITELKKGIAFYLGCTNLYNFFKKKGVKMCYPEPLDNKKRIYDFKDLTDVVFDIDLDKVQGNSTTAKNIVLGIITGANQGGKTVYLRSLGQSQLMMQAGMFVCAESYSANIVNGIYTHFRREEDSSMQSGKLDEELMRMSAIIDNVNDDSLILFNESFSSTNDREGSEICRQIIDALIERGVKIFFVTHLSDFPMSYYKRKMVDIMFLRAERLDDGTRTFRIVEGEPLDTSYGQDLFASVMGE